MTAPLLSPMSGADGCDASVEMSLLIVQFSDWMDSTYGPEVSAGEALFRRTTNKIAEELGELGEALGGWIGENPRKGVLNDHERVLSELMDIAGAALGAAVHVSRRAGIEPEPMRMLLDKFRFITERVGLPLVTAAATPAAPVETELGDDEPWYEFYTPAGDRFADVLVQAALAAGPLTAEQVEVELAVIQARCAEAGFGEASDTACRESLTAALERGISPDVLGGDRG
jgi:NTP pyrophosphatase (non-canonical NTP hydrolase)